jgi:hypothetical protein
MIMSINQMGEGQRRQPLALVEPDRYEEEFPIINLTREQADMVVRNYADLYYQTHGCDNTERLTGFTLWLSWCVGGRIEEGELFEVVEAFHELAKHYAGDSRRDVDELESNLNVAVNRVLDTAHVHGPWINRYDMVLGRTA